MNNASNEVKRYQITLTISVAEDSLRLVLPSLEEGMEFEEGEGIESYNVVEVESVDK